MGVQDFDIICTYLNNVSVLIAFFILKIYFGVGVSFSWRDLEWLNLLDGKVDPDDFSHRSIGLISRARE